MAYLTISDVEWEKAERFFSNANNANKKLRRQDDPYYKKEDLSTHSFIKVNNEIYALAPNEYLGFGTFGKVKIVQNKAGELFAVKIEEREAREETSDAIRAQRLIGYYIGQFSRIFGGFFSEKNKLYTVTQLREGQELFEYLYDDKDAQYSKNELTYTQKLIVAIKCSLALRKLHQKRIIHADIKPENFMAQIEGNDIKIETIDFDFTMILKKGYTSMENDLMGTPAYLPPEVEKYQKYSFASDIYSLGILFQSDLELPNYLIMDMCDMHPENRDSLKIVLKRLLEELKKQNDIDKEAHKVIHDVSALLQPLPLPLVAKPYHDHITTYNTLLFGYQPIPPVIDHIEEGKVEYLTDRINAIELEKKKRVSYYQ